MACDVSPVAMFKCQISNSVIWKQQWVTDPYQSPQKAEYEYEYEYV